ncbi:MAG TPA: ABC transporter substrate-binding protein [Levilinea sp.]|nr:ABC transporter substrate-binding protein [Levilinea sp.]
MRRLVLSLISMVFFLMGCQPAVPSPAVPIEAPLSMTFMAGFKPQANLPFAGVYVAQEKGFFADENLAVTIEHSPGQGQHLQLLATGKVQVTTQDAAVLLKRRADPGLPLVSIALIGQRGQQAFAALTSSGLKTPLDWQGHTVGYKGLPPPDLYALLGKAGADVNEIELVNVGFDPRMLAEGMVDVYPVFKSNEPYLLQSWGYELVLWDAADFGVPTLGLAFVTSDETLKTQPETLERFLRAALKGIEYAAQNPEEAVDIVLQYTGPGTSREHMLFMLNAELAERESEFTQGYGAGWQTETQWQALADMLVEFDAMPPVDVNQVFTTQILAAVRDR